jgi:hypothetical protein
MRELGFYYPGYYWRNDSLAKSLLLFFDGLALLVPEDDVDQLVSTDEYLKLPLVEQGILRILTPEDIIDEATANELAFSISSLLDAGLSDRLRRSGVTSDDSETLDDVTMDALPFVHLSRSRAAPSSSEVAALVFDQLLDLGLARVTDRPETVAMHPVVRDTYLVLYSQLLRIPARQRDLDLVPLTDRPELHQTLKRVFDGLVVAHPGADLVGRTYSSDIQELGLRLDSVPLDDLLQFREDHGAAFRAYRRHLRQFARELLELDDEERLMRAEERQQELADSLEDLKARAARQSWIRFGSLLLGTTGAVFAGTTGGVATGLLGVGGVALSFLRDADLSGPDAYSYLYSVSRAFPT